MKIILFSFTKQASLLSLTIKERLNNLYRSSNSQFTCIPYTIHKYADCEELTPLTKSLQDTVCEHFEKGNVLIFIGATGIAVRAIAPFVNDKASDPCVLVIDELGNYVISLLSGHLGGGNEFAEKISKLIHATPIISTATDLNHRFAVDVFAKKNNLLLSDMKIAKMISADLLDNKQVGISGLVPKGNLPKGICYESPIKLSTGFCISPFAKNPPFEHTLYLIPKQVVLGIGCKKDTSPFALQEFVNETLEEQGIFKTAVCAIVSIDLKAKEPALLELSSTYQVPFITYSADELLKVPGDFTTSEFVRKITGVDNVCERSTLAYSKADNLFLRKTARNGMTIAISLLPVSCEF